MQVRSISKLKIGRIFLCAAIAVYALSIQTKAEGSENRFSAIANFTDISLWYADENGEPYQKIEKDGTLLEKNAGLALRYDYQITADKMIEADTPYYLEISPHLLPDLPGGIPLEAEMEGEAPVAFGSIYASKTEAKAWIQFTADGSGTVLKKLLTENGMEDFQGYFYLKCGRAKNPPAEEEENRYTMEIEGKELFSFGYQELERSEEKAKIIKGGSLQGKTITWTIDYTPWQNPDSDGPDKITADTAFELRDIIDGTKHSYAAGSIEADGIKVKEYAPGDQVPEDAEIYAVIENTESGTVLNIGGKELCAGNAPAGNPAQPIKITYRTVLNDTLLLPGNEDSLEVANEVMLYAKKEGSFQGTGISGSCKTKVEPHKWIEKAGNTTRVNGNGSYTKWTITFSPPNGFTVPQGSELTLHDQLPEGSTLVKESIEIDKVKAEEDDIKIEGGNQFSVSVNKEVTQPVVITYRTTVPEKKYEDGEDLGKNIAWFTFSYQENPYETLRAEKSVGSGDGSGTSGTAALVKNHGEYQKGSRSIAWTVDINHHKAYLKGGTFTDDLRETTVGSCCNIDGHKKGLELTGGMSGVEVLLDGPATETEKEELASRITLDYTDQVLTVTVGDIGFTKITLRYTTNVCDPCIYANNTDNKTFKNEISTDDMLIGKDSIQGQERHASGVSTVDVSATVLTKQPPVYDYGRGVMRWTVEVNAAGLPMRDVRLTDALPAGLTYADGDGTFQSGADSTFQTDPHLPDASLTASDAGKNLTIDLGDINTKTLVLFETKVDPMSAGFNSDMDVVIENTAAMNGRIDDGTANGVVFEEVRAGVRHSFANHGLVKSSETNNREEWIDYKVLINPYGLSLPQTFSLVDTLDRRLQLSEDIPLRAYKATVSGTSDNEGQKPDYEIKENEPALKVDGYDYDPETNSYAIKLRLPEKSPEAPEPEKSAYVLTYRADIIERQSGGYGNSVRFEGGAVKLGGLKQNSAQVNGGGGGGGGVLSRKAVIAVTHTDSITGQPLSGVTYTLYEWDTVNNRRMKAVARGVTDAQGKVSFKVKPGAVYELVQTGGIPGYNDVPEWDQLPDDGVLQGGAGLLVTAGAAGFERKLELANKKGESTGPSGSGDTDHTGNTGDGGSGGEGSKPDSAENSENSGSAENGANPEKTEVRHAGIAVNSPKTGDSNPEEAFRLLFLGIAAGITAVFLFRTGKKNEGKQLWMGKR